VRNLVAIFFALFAMATGTMAEERIGNFHSDVTVNADASLTVRETISVNAEGASIRHGIFRDIPTIYSDRHGVRLRVDLEVLDVKRDDHAENYSEESLTNGIRIRIGSADTYLDYGVHVYEITYRITRELGFFNTYDELFWNVTGNGWQFVIDRASVHVRLPPGAAIQQDAAYTGYAGTSGRDFRIVSRDHGEYVVETTAPLEPGEGFTIAVAWQKGVVIEPTEIDQWRWWVKDNGGIFGLIVTLLAVGTYYTLSWNKVGRDPPKGVIVPTFVPPSGMGPADARFVWKEGYDDRALAAALVGLAVKGRVKIADDDQSYVIEKAGQGDRALERSEQALYDTLPAGKTVLNQSNHVQISVLRATLRKALGAQFEGTAFIRNLAYFVRGAILSAIGLIASALLLPVQDSAPALFMAVFSSIWWGVILVFIWGAIKGLFAGRGVVAKAGSIFKLIFMIPFIGGGIAVPGAFLLTGASPVLFLVIGSAALLGLMNLLFFYLLKAPTLEGRKLLDQLAGFRMYLSTAEEGRLNLLNPPDKTPQLFERYLPYALALGCESEWNERFTATLAAAAATGAATSPAWYSGSHWDAENLDGFTSSIGSSLASSISSSSTAPGSSSGSGGGGSSGGGGGGGGGGGW
jgi:uncharacterized membrane protein YgcG